MFPLYSVLSSYNPSLINFTNFLGNLSCVFKRSRPYFLLFLFQSGHERLKISSVGSYLTFHITKVIIVSIYGNFWTQNPCVKV